MSLNTLDYTATKVLHTARIIHFQLNAQQPELQPACVSLPVVILPSVKAPQLAVYTHLLFNEYATNQPTR